MGNKHRIGGDKTMNKIIIKRRVNKNLANSPILERLQELEQRVQEKRNRIDAVKARKEAKLKNRSE